MSPSDARMARLRPVTGYAGAWDWTRDVGAPADDGIFRVDIGTGRKSLIVSFAKLKEALRGTVENLDAPVFLSTWNQGPLRLDPAPAWNRTSDAIVVPGIAGDGTRQMFLLEVSR